MTSPRESSATGNRVEESNSQLPDSTPANASPATIFRFLDLPAELRVLVYEYVVRAGQDRDGFTDIMAIDFKSMPSILIVCKLIWTEVESVWKQHVSNADFSASCESSADVKKAVRVARRELFQPQGDVETRRFHIIVTRLFCPHLDLKPFWPVYLLQMKLLSVLEWQRGIKLSIRYEPADSSEPPTNAGIGAFFDHYVKDVLLDAEEYAQPSSGIPYLDSERTAFKEWCDGVSGEAWRAHDYLPVD